MGDGFNLTQFGMVVARRSRTQLEAGTGGPVLKVLQAAKVPGAAKLSKTSESDLSVPDLSEIADDYKP